MATPSLAKESVSGGSIRLRYLRRGPLVRTPFLIMLYTVDTWKWYLCARQLEFVFRNGLPDVLEGYISPSDYDKIRLKTALTTLSEMVVITYRLYSYSRTLFKGAATTLWSRTAEVSNNLELRTILWVFVINLADYLWMMAVVVIQSSLKRDSGRTPWEVAKAGVPLVIFGSLGAAAETFIMIKATNRYGPRIILILSVLKETSRILLDVARILVYGPEVLVTLPGGSHKSEINAVAERAGYKHGVYMNPSTREGLSEPSILHVGAFGASMIVVDESLLNIVSPQEVAGLMAHELGHWNDFHYLCKPLGNLIAAAVLTRASIWSYGNDEFYNVLKFDPTDPPHPVLGVLLFKHHLYPSIHHVIMGLKHTLYYFCGYSADDYAFRIGLGSELVDALLKIFRKVQRFPHGDSWYTAWTNAHPNLVERIEFMNKHPTY